MDLTLLPCDCVKGMTVQYKLAYIYAALYQLAGAPSDLPLPECVLGQPLMSQVSFIYCAALAWRDTA